MIALRFLAAMFPGLARILAFAAWTIAAILAGAVLERGRAVSQAAVDARGWPWVEGTWEAVR